MWHLKLSLLAGCVIVPSTTQNVDVGLFRQLLQSSSSHAQAYNNAYLAPGYYPGFYHPPNRYLPYRPYRDYDVPQKDLYRDYQYSQNEPYRNNYQQPQGNAYRNYQEPQRNYYRNYNDPYRQNRPDLRGYFNYQGYAPGVSQNSNHLFTGYTRDDNPRTLAELGRYLSRATPPVRGQDYPSSQDNYPDPVDLLYNTHFKRKRK